jgi:hypothetical protein
VIIIIFENHASLFIFDVFVMSFSVFNNLEPYVLILNVFYFG